MTIEEAIKNREKCLEYLERLGPRATRENVEAVRMSIEALRAQQAPTKLDRSRWEGCEYCAGSEKGECSICKYRGDFEECDSYFQYPCSNFSPFNFCGNCGKPLTEEAWAELKKRKED